MNCAYGTFFARNGAALTGLEDIIFTAIASYPNKDVYADIRRVGKNYSFELLESPPSSPPDKSSLSPNHVGYLFSRRLKSVCDCDFGRRLQPSVLDLRSMYESGDAVRAFIATNGAGWAFRLFNFQDLSLAELDWLESGFVKSTRSSKDLELFLDHLPKRMALSMLQRDERMVRFLVDESRTIGTRIDRLQDYYGALPTQSLARLLSMAGSVITIGESFLQEGNLLIDDIFEHHIVEAFNSIKQGDVKSAFAEILKFSVPTTGALTRLEDRDDKIRKIEEVNSRLRELRLPSVPESRQLKALIAFLEETLECAYSFFVEGNKKLRTRHDERGELDRAPTTSNSLDSSHQSVLAEGQVFHGINEFIAEAIWNHPNIVLGQIRRSAEAPNRFSITDLRVLPCDIMIKHSVATRSEKVTMEALGGERLAGKAVSRVCECEYEMLCSLHPETRILNEMLRSGYVLNAIAVTNGEKCVFRLHDGSNNTLAYAHTA
jgi:hypothetical protein